MSTALVIHPDGEIIEVNLQPGADHVALMRQYLGCSVIDCVALTDRLDMWVDDEGLHTQPVNPVATALARHHGRTWQPYHGPALLCRVDAGGDSVDLDTAQVRALLTQLRDVVNEP